MEIVKIGEQCYTTSDFLRSVDAMMEMRLRRRRSEGGLDEETGLPLDEHGEVIKEEKENAG